jgi:hypothetical protein
LASTVLPGCPEHLDLNKIVATVDPEKRSVGELVLAVF